MSRIIQQIATVQFQVDNRKVTASMNALQTEAESLNGKIAAVKQSIKTLGEVPADNKFLLEYQKQLRQLNSDLKDVTTAQRDLMKGVKAADQLWKAAATQDIESLSIKAIKAGQNGLRKRMDNLRPELGGDEQKMYEAYKAVIDEADRVMNVFKSNYAAVVQTIRDGGIVSEQVMKSTRDALRDLMEAEKEGTAEHRQLAQQYDFLNESLANVAEMRRREKGEIVNANDARREALKLTEDGIAAARRERDMADATIASMQEQKDNLDQQRKLHEDRIAQTEREIAANQRLEEAEQDRLADVEKAMRYTENEDRREAIRLRKKADAARDEAEAKNDAYEQQAEQEKLLRQHVKDTGDEVANLTAKIEALGKTEAKPKVDTSEIDGLKAKLEELKKKRNVENLEGISYLSLQSKAALPGNWELERSGYVQKFAEKFGLQDSYAKRNERVVARDMFHGPEESTIWDIEDWYNGEANGFGYTKEEWKKLLDDYKWFEDNLRAVTDAIKAQYEKLGQASREGVDPESLKGVANGIKKLEALKERMLSVAAKDNQNDYGIGSGEWFRKQFGDVEGDMKKAVETVERGLKDVTGMRSSAYKKKLEEEHATWKEKAENSEKTIRELEREIKTIELTIAAISGETEALKKQEQVIGQLKEEHQGLVNAQVEAHRKNELLTTGEAFSASGERLIDKRAFQASIIEEAEKISPYTRGSQFVLDKDQTKALVENLAKQYKVAYKEMEDRLRAVFNGNQGEGSLFDTSGFDATSGQYYFEKNWEAVYKFEDEVRKSKDVVADADAAAEESSKKLYDAQLALKDARQKSAEILQQSTTATNGQTEAIKKQEEELGKLKQKLKRLEEARDDAQNDVKESLKAVKDMGLTEEDLADDAKVREAVEKKVLEIMEAQAKVGQEIAEQRKKLAGEVKMSDLGGTKADQEFYAKNKGRWDASDYASPDDMIERIAHLERLKRLKNGKRFNPDEDWDDDDELDEDAPVMNDKEKQAINDELRFLKQHIREELLKTIKEVGDFDKAVEQYTGGDGVSEDAKFGEQLNDKIGEIKDKIEERIETSLDRYGEMLNEDRDIDSKMTKEQLTERVSQHMEYVKENHGTNRSWIEETQGDIKATKDEIAAKEQLIEKMKQQAAAAKESSQADQQSVDVSKQKAELEGQLADATKKHTKAVKDYEAQQEKTNKAQEKAYRAQEESVALNDKAATAEEKVAHQEERHAEAMDQQSERLRQIRAEGQRLLDQYEQQKTEIQAVDKAWADADVKQGEAEARKAQNQELTIKSLDDSIRKLKEANAVIDSNSDEWEENTRIIRKLQQAQDEISQKQKEMMGEWMSLADAQKMADSVGTSGFVATDAQIKQATEALNRHRESLIKTIQERERDGQAAAEERSQLTQLDAQLAKLKTGFGSADEVMSRFNGHMNAGKTASEGMASAFDEKLSQATSVYDTQIEDAVKDVEDYEQQIREATQELADMEKELAELEAKHKNSSWFRKQTKEYKREAWHIEDLREGINGREVTLDDGTTYRTVQGQKRKIEDLKGDKKDAQETLDYWKKQKAEELNITEEVEKKKQDTQRLTQEQMQEGIKLLEEEYRKTDHTTEAGIKRREQLRQTIDQMNQEIKESTGEWMSYAEAEKFAAQAGTEGFIATGQQMKQAQEALERQRDTLIKSIQAKRQEKNMTDEQKKALAAEEAQLDKVNTELKKMTFEMGNTNMSAKRMNEILDNPSVAKNIEELGQAVKRAQAQLKMMEDTVGNTNEEYKEMAQKTKEAAQRQKELEVQFKASASAFDKAWSRLKTYVGLYVGASVAMQKLTGTMGDLMDLSDKMGEVRKTTGFTADEVGRLSGELKNFDTRTALNGLLDLSVAAGQLGLKTEEDVLGFTEAANKLMVALPEMGREGATEMLKVALATGEIDKIRKQMEQGLIEGSSATAVAMEKVGSTIDRLRATSAATAPAITDFVKRVGAVGAQSGISIDQVAALGSTVDALGMRVEMSATALSRMIPAIKNNAFAVAKAIKVEPETLRNLFETGRGMEAILMIFQHIKDSGMDADSIESMLGMGGMQEVMKELNQMGARAGIVFSGLSQNVDELRRQLGVANEAYEENLAIQQEYDKMNETTLAKWERLKNELEEAFVSDFWQRQMGNIIEFLRIIVNLLTGNVHPALQLVTAAIHTFTIYWMVLKAGIGEAIFVKAAAGLKAMGSGLMDLIPTTQAYIKYSILMSRAQQQLKAATDAASIALAKQKVAAIESRMAQEGLNKAMIANVWTAVAMAIMTAVYGLYHWIQNLRESAIEAGRFEAQVQKETKAANKLIDAIGEARVKIEDADKAVEKARKDLEEAKKANDGTTEAVKRLKDAEVELAVQEEKKRKALAEHKYMIEQFNNQYSKYLGFMLSEVASNIELANARDLVNSKLRETITLKQQEAGLERVEKEHGESRDEQYGKLKGLVYEQIKDPTKAARAMKELTDAARAFDNKAIDKTLRTYGIRFGRMQQAVWDYRNELKEIKDATDAVIEQYAGQAADDREVSQKNLARQADAAIVTYRKRLNTYKSARGDDRAKAAADVLKQMDTLEEMRKNASGYYKMDSSEQGKIEEARYKQQMRGLISWQGSDRDALLKEAGKYYTPRGTVNGDTTTSVKDPTGGGWGKDLPAESTDWKNMTAEQLVNRRKQMKDFVNAIQTDTDVQAVLKEDAALKAAIEKGMSSDMRTVIEWYNTERLKIQDELHARHLTNTGDWMDPKKERGAKKQFRDEMDAYLHELDAYYTERKTRIEEAGTDEGLTEAEIRNRTLNNEMEWQQRRAELQKLYSRKQKEVTQEELDAIYHIIAERTGDSESFVKAQIAKTNQFVNNIEKSGEKGAAIVHRWMSQVELDTERSYLKGQQALTKQMRAIEAIIDKERPFNGITKSLQESLSTMDILTGEMRKEYNELMKQGKDTADFNARQHQEEMKRTAFLLGEAENAYSTTIDRVMDDMRQKGMTAWADWLSADPKLQEALMAQLRSTYDAIQDAIKKEASQLKKQAEIMWNNILMPDGQTTLKQQIDRIVAQLSLDESRVKRANSLIGAGQASERVADKLAIQQMKVQLAMQEHYYNLMRKRGQATVENLEKEAKAAKERLDWQQYEQKMLDAKHARMSLNLATAKEETELAKQREEIVARTEESQNRLYQELRSWADLLTSSLQGMFEAAHAGDAEYYNELAKMNLTGKGGPGAGTYIVIDDEGTEDATAHYEYLTEREALEREHEIEIQNARAEAWRKLMDDVNQKMSDTITDQLNAMLQNKATEDNTAELQKLQVKIDEEMGKMDSSVEATNANTDAIRANTEAVLAAMNSKEGAATGIDTAIANGIGADMGIGSDGVPNALRAPAEGESGASAGTGVTAYTAPWQQPAQEQQTQGDGWLSPMMPLAPETDMEAFTAPWAAYAEMSSKTTKTVTENNKRQAASTSSMFAKMTQAANLYGVAYQAMSNDNLDTAQKFEMIALQAVGNAAIAGLGVALEEMGAKTAVNTAETASKDTAEHGSILGPILTALSTAVLGGLMGLATSKIAKSKSKIASITGANAGAGRLATGMLTYAEGNVNEFTDPASLTPGRRYNVDAADGRKYRARYMGSNPRTHITNGPEFHLSGEKGREMIIDAGTTRQITMNETEVWNAIKTLSGGGRIHHALRRGRGVRAFADGNVEDFMGSGDIATYGAMGAEQMTAFQQSLDRNNELLERALTEGIKGVFDVYGKGGLVDSYDTGKRTVTRYGESY